MLNNIYTESEFLYVAIRENRDSSELLHNKLSKELQTSSHGMLELSQPSKIEGSIPMDENAYSQLDKLSKKSHRTKRASQVKMLKKPGV